MYDFAIVGGGIVGLSTALALTERYRGAAVLLLEKEDRFAAHQTGRNSGVIHSGLYYKPGSLKATLCREGNRAMVAFCREHGIGHEVCGKVIVASRRRELEGLEKLYRRGIENGLDVRKLEAPDLRAIEPNVRAVGSIYIPSAGIADYKGVAQTFARLAKERGAELRLGSEVTGWQSSADAVTLTTSKGERLRARFVVNCGGLMSDRLARRAGVDPGCKIVPFRGEYYELAPAKHALVNGLIYPVPDPAFPFLGVHLTRMVGGGVHAGPNAVLAFKREGYRKSDIDLRDLGEVLTYPGFWKLASRHASAGWEEMVRSLRKDLFVQSLQRLVPDVQAEDLVASPAGVRAQALAADGALVDDFLFVEGQNALHVCNAPSPAATASIPIGKAIAERIARLVPTPRPITGINLAEEPRSGAGAISES